MTDKEKVETGDFRPKILSYSTERISDPGIDRAGSSHLHYPPTVVVITLPCSSIVKPQWLVYAIENGFDGVFIAADGEECAYLPDCTDRTAKTVMYAQERLKEKGYEPERLKMAGICSVCDESFVNYTREFYKTLKRLGPVKKEG